MYSTYGLDDDNKINHLTKEDKYNYLGTCMKKCNNELDLKNNLLNFNSLSLEEFVKSSNDNELEDEIKLNKNIKNKCCKNPIINYRMEQTRSGDEPSTIFCECKSCGKRWKH